MNILFYKGRVIFSRAISLQRARSLARRDCDDKSERSSVQFELATEATRFARNFLSCGSFSFAPLAAESLKVHRSFPAKASRGQCSTLIKLSVLCSFCLSGLIKRLQIQWANLMGWECEGYSEFIWGFSWLHPLVPTARYQWYEQAIRVQKNDIMQNCAIKCLYFLRYKKI